MYRIPTLPLRQEVETKPVLKQAALASRQLAELKGIAQTIPNENILINCLKVNAVHSASERLTKRTLNFSVAATVVPVDSVNNFGFQLHNTYICTVN